MTIESQLAKSGIVVVREDPSKWRARFAVRFADTEVLSRNLIDFKEVLDKHSLLFFLAQGTLLAAARDGRFFDHSRDCDLYMFWEDRYRLTEAAKDFLAKGFTIVKLIELKNVKKIAFGRDGELIDINFLRPCRRGPFEYLRTQDGIYPIRYFSSPEQIEFLGKTFLAPRNHKTYLKRRYGRTWRQVVHKIADPSSFAHLFASTDDHRLILAVRFPFWSYRFLAYTPVTVTRPAGIPEAGSIVFFESGDQSCLRYIREVRGDGFVKVNGTSALTTETWWPESKILAKAETLILGGVAIPLNTPVARLMIRLLANVVTGSKRIGRTLRVRAP